MLIWLEIDQFLFFFFIFFFSISKYKSIVWKIMLNDADNNE